jgi:hypothetical protein
MLLTLYLYLVVMCKVIIKWNPMFGKTSWENGDGAEGVLGGKKFEPGLGTLPASTRCRATASF